MDTDDFAKVQEALWAARAKWHNIGIRLDLGVFELDCINAEPGFGLGEKFNLMIKNRLKKSEPCTWRELYDALNHPTVDMASVADKLPVKRPTSECMNVTEQTCSLNCESALRANITKYAYF